MGQTSLAEVKLTEDLALEISVTKVDREKSADRPLTQIA